MGQPLRETVIGEFINLMYSSCEVHNSEGSKEI